MKHRQDRTPKQRKELNQKERKIKKRLIDSVAILNRAVVAYYLLIRLEGLLMQSARHPVGREKAL